jgi:hypothetical protein
MTKLYVNDEITLFDGTYITGLQQDFLNIVANPGCLSRFPDPWSKRHRIPGIFNTECKQF